MGGLNRLTSLALVLAAAAWPRLEAAADDRPPAAKRSPSIQARVDFYERQVARFPKHYTACAMLGDAYLDRARSSHDAADLARAQAILERSLSIQESFEAYRTLAALANFRHRFADALRWGRLAAQALPPDTGVTALRVESHLGLGQLTQALKLLPDSDPPPNDFHLAAALGAVRVEQGKPDEAVKAFLKASEVAAGLHVPELAQWARVRAAGAWLDAGHADRARPLLEAAAKLDPTDPFLRLHQAELLAADGHHAEALAAIEGLLRAQDDPALHARAASLARKLGREVEARRHFEAAERSFRNALERGEIFPLEALARLYLDAGLKPDEARALARRNLQFKRDRAARQLMERAQRSPSDAPPSASSPRSSAPGARGITALVVLPDRHVT